MYEFYLESQSTYYPVSLYDYLMVIITSLVVTLYPLKVQHVKYLSLSISFSPTVIFLTHWPTLDFSARNDFGLINPNWLGLYCCICLPLIICTAIDKIRGIDRQSKDKKIFNIISLIILKTSLLITFIMMFMSGSRSSLYTGILIIVIIVSIVTKSLIKSTQAFNISRIKSIFFGFYIISFLAFCAVVYRLLLSKFIFLGRFVELANSTNSYRLKIYKCYLDLGLEKPWLGWGIDNTAAMCEQRLKARLGGVNHAHNFVLQLFADHGLIITLICLIIIIYFIILPMMIFIVSYDLSQNTPFMYVGIFLASLSIVIVSLFQSAFYHYPLFPLLLGLFWGCQLDFQRRLSEVKKISDSFVAKSSKAS